MLEPVSAASRRALLRWLDIVMRRPAVVVGSALVVTVVALAYTLGTLGINTSTVDMISPELPFRQHALAYKRAFPTFDKPIVAVIDGQTPERTTAAARALADALRADETHFAAVDYMGGEPFFDQHGLLYLDVDELAALTDRLAAAQPLIAALAEDPTLRGLAGFVELALQQGQGDDGLPEQLDRLLGAMAEVVETQIAGEPGVLSWRGLMRGGDEPPDTRAIVIAQPRLDRDSLVRAGDAIETVRQLGDELGIDAARGLRLRLTGDAVLSAEELESVSRGASLAAVLTTVAVAALLVWGLRSYRLILATLLTLAAGLIATAGFATLAVGELNLISAAFAVLFVGLGVDFGIHLNLRFREAVKRGMPMRPALRTAVMGVAGALSLSALCAALGFLSFVPTDYQGLAELGIIAAGGMVIAWFASLTLLPALLCLSPPRRAALGETALHAPPLTRTNRPLLAVAALAAIASTAVLPRVQFDPNPLNLKDPKAESVATFMDLAEGRRTSPYGIDILASGLDDAQAVAARLQDLDEVERVVTLASFVPENQEAKLDLIEPLAFYLGPVLSPPTVADLDADARRTAFEDLRARLGAAGGPAASAGAERLDAALGEFALRFDHASTALAELEARLTGFLPDLLDQLRRGLDAGPVTLDDLPESLRDRWLTADGRARILVQPAGQVVDNEQLRRFAHAVLARAPAATGPPVVITAAGDTVIAAFREASVYALVMITLVLAVVLRDWRDILLVLVPLGLAVLYTAATTVAFGLSFNFANVIVLPLLLGLGVSGAIHVVIRRRQSDRNDLFGTSTPRAVLFSALTTIASFGSLAISDHRGLASMGLLLTIAILWSLAANLCILPSMLAMIRPGARREESAQASPAHPGE